MRTCENCAWYHRQSGACRCFPPKLLLVGSQPGIMEYQAMWPTMQPDSWCGEHVEEQERDKMGND